MLSLRTFTLAFGADQPLYGIQAYVDRDIEAGEIGAVEDTARACLDVLLEAQPSGPYLIGGHSIGGHVAYEMAALLEEAGESVLLLSLLDPAAPHTLRKRGRLVARARELTGTGSEPRRPQPHLAVVSAISRRLQSVTRGANAPGAASVEADARLWMRNLEAVEREHRPRSYSGRVMIYTTGDGARYTGSATLGWERYVSGPLEARRVPGDHVSMLLDPNVEALAAAMDADIREVQAATGP
jgi:thioesterase domain-containing protein